MDTTERKAVFVPGCLLCHSFQAAENPANVGWNVKIVSLLLGFGVNLVALPCPETLYWGVGKGVVRGKHGIDYYSRLDGFTELCLNLAVSSEKKIKEYLNGGYSVPFILGIENSPTCAASYMYTSHGTQKRLGMFYDFLVRELEKDGLHIPLLGINRGHIEKAVREIKQVLG